MRCLATPAVALVVACFSLYTGQGSPLCLHQRPADEPEGRPAAAVSEFVEPCRDFVRLEDTFKTHSTTHPVVDRKETKNDSQSHRQETSPLHNAASSNLPTSSRPRGHVRGKCGERRTAGRGEPNRDCQQAGDPINSVWYPKRISVGAEIRIPVSIETQRKSSPASLLPTAAYVPPPLQGGAFQPPTGGQTTRL